MKGRIGMLNYLRYWAQQTVCAACLGILLFGGLRRRRVRWRTGVAHDHFKKMRTRHNCGIRERARNRW